MNTKTNHFLIEKIEKGISDLEKTKLQYEDELKKYEGVYGSKIKEQLQQEIKDKIEIELKQKQEEVKKLKSAYDIKQKMEEKQKELVDRIERFSREKVDYQKEIESLKRRNDPDTGKKITQYEEDVKRIDKEISKLQKDLEENNKEIAEHEKKIREIYEKYGVKEEQEVENEPETAQTQEQEAENKPETKQTQEQEAENKPETEQAQEQEAENKPETEQAQEQEAENKPETAQTQDRGNGQRTIIEPEHFPEYDEESTKTNEHRIVAIDFKFENGKPIYIVTDNNGREFECEARNNYYEEFKSYEEKNIFDEKIGFKGASKNIDINILAICKGYDKMFGTYEENRYKQLVKDGINRKLDESKKYFDIVYDLRGAKEADVPQNVKRIIKNIAKRSDKFNIAGYTKDRGFFARLLDKIRQPKLAPAKEDEQFKYNSEPEYTDKEKRNMSEEKLTIDDAIRHYMNEKDTESFNKKDFYAQLRRGGYSLEDLKELNKRIEEKDKAKSKAKNVFRESIKLSGGSKGKFSKNAEPKDRTSKTESVKYTIEEIDER